MSYNYITDSHTNAIYKTTSPDGVKLIQRYMNQVGGADCHRRSPEHPAYQCLSLSATAMRVLEFCNSV